MKLRQGNVVTSINSRILPTEGMCMVGAGHIAGGAMAPEGRGVHGRGHVWQGAMHGRGHT